MSRRYSLVLEGSSATLSGVAFDPLEQMLMVLCGVLSPALRPPCSLRCRNPISLAPSAMGAGGDDDVFSFTASSSGRQRRTRRNDHLSLSAISEALTGRTRLIVETFTPPSDARHCFVHGLFRLPELSAGI